MRRAIVSLLLAVAVLATMGAGFRSGSRWGTGIGPGFAPVGRAVGVAAAPVDPLTPPTATWLWYFSEVDYASNAVGVPASLTIHLGDGSVYVASQPTENLKPIQNKDYLQANGTGGAGMHAEWPSGTTAALGGAVFVVVSGTRTTSYLAACSLNGGPMPGQSVFYAGTVGAYPMGSTIAEGTAFPGMAFTNENVKLLTYIHSATNQVYSRVNGASVGTLTYGLTNYPATFSIGILCDYKTSSQVYSPAAGTNLHFYGAVASPTTAQIDAINSYLMTRYSITPGATP